MPARRLTSREYLNTVRDLLDRHDARSVDDVPGEADDLSNNAFPFRQPTAIGTLDAANVQVAAEALAKNMSTQAVDDPALHARERVGRGGLRRHVHHDVRREGVPAPAVDRRDDDADQPLQHGRARRWRSTSTARSCLLVEAMLQSPGFLYHWEMDPGPAIKDGAVVQLGNYQIANRLSYFLWGTMPDATLFTAAQSGQLSTADGVQTQVTRMLADTKAQAFVADFIDDWLDVNVLVLAAQGSDAVRDVEPGPRVRDGDRVPQLRHHRRARHAGCSPI